MRWYFDYISPFAYLQSTVLNSIATQAKSADESLECVPVLFAGLLDHWGNVGPAEIAPKREWTFRHVVWLAHRDNIPFKLPVHHPFNPLPLLRLGIVLGNEITVVQRLFRFVWVDGHVPQNESAFDALLAEFGVSHGDLQSDAVKTALIENGHAAMKQGVFGVPSLTVNNEIFWGYDSTDMALSFIGDSDWPEKEMAAAVALPEGKGRSR